MTRVSDYVKQYAANRVKYNPRLAESELLEGVGKSYVAIDEKKRTKRLNNVIVVNDDCIEVAYKMQTEEKLNPLVLNMASDFKPGGAWEGLRIAQEESIFLRSTYCMALRNCS